MEHLFDGAPWEEFLFHLLLVLATADGAVSFIGPAKVSALALHLFQVIEISQGFFENSIWELSHVLVPKCCWLQHPQDSHPSHCELNGGPFVSERVALRAIVSAIRSGFVVFALGELADAAVCVAEGFRLHSTA